MNIHNATDFVKFHPEQSATVPFVLTAGSFAGMGDFRAAAAIAAGTAVYWIARMGIAAFNALRLAGAPPGYIPNYRELDRKNMIASTALAAATTAGVLLWPYLSASDYCKAPAVITAPQQPSSPGTSIPAHRPNP